MRDLCLEALGVRAESSTPHQDAFSLRTLLRPDKHTPAGFLAASFTQPPVRIAVHFPFLVRIDAIRLGLRLHTHTTARFALALQTHTGSLYRLPAHTATATDTVTAACIAADAFPLAACAAVRTVHITLLAPARTGDPCCLSQLFIHGAVSALEPPAVHRHVDALYPPLPDPRPADHKARPAPPPVRYEVCPPLPVLTACPPQILDVFAPRVPAADPAPRCEPPPAPDEFLDMITFDVMRDPVRLPSGAVVDRATLDRHLATRLTDPFTNAPLDPAAVCPLPALRLRIRAHLLAACPPSPVSKRRRCDADPVHKAPE